MSVITKIQPLGSSTIYELNATYVGGICAPTVLNAGTISTYGTQIRTTIGNGAYTCITVPYATSAASVGYNFKITVDNTTPVIYNGSSEITWATNAVSQESTTLIPFTVNSVSASSTTEASASVSLGSNGFDFSFGLKTGDKGDKGDTGETGAQGAQGDDYVPSIVDGVNIVFTKTTEASSPATVQYAIYDGYINTCATTLYNITTTVSSATSTNIPTEGAVYNHIKMSYSGGVLTITTT